MTNVDGKDEREPRHFWRRAFAFLLDIVIAQLIVALLFSAVDAAAGTTFGDSPAVSASECSPAPAGHPQAIRVEGMWPLPAGGRRDNTVCRYGSGEDQSWTFTTHVAWKEGTTDYSKEVSFDIDKDGKALPAAYAPNFEPFAIVLLFLVLAATGWRSPGKVMMGLRLTGADKAAPSRRQAAGREMLRLLPLVVLGVLVTLVAVVPPALLTDSEAALVGMRDGWIPASPEALFLLAWYGAALLWWLAPFIVWRGRSWHDALAGTKVVLSDLPASASRRQ